jgi:hypothetical protein
MIVSENEVINYNSTYNVRNSNPNLLFGDSKPQNVIELTEDLFNYVMLESTARTLKNQLIEIDVHKKKYQYLIWDATFLEKYLYKNITVRYDQNNPESIFIYEEKGIKIILQIEAWKPYHMAKVNQTSDDKLKILELKNKRKQLRKILKEKKDELTESLKCLPLNAVIYSNDSKETIHNSEENTIIPIKNIKDGAQKRSKDLPIKDEEDKGNTIYDFDMIHKPIGSGKLL